MTADSFPDDIQKAHQLRCSCLRATLTVETPDDNNTDFPSYSHVVEKDERHLQHILQTVLERSAKILKPVKAAEEAMRTRELSHLIKAFMLFSIRWNVQEPHTFAWLREDFKGITFEFRNSYFGYHRANGLGNDTDEPSDAVLALTGREVDLVVEPALLRSGNEKGEMYDKRRVLQPAVVWMVRPEDSQPKTLTTSPSLAAQTKPMPQHKTQMPRAGGRDVHPPTDKSNRKQLHQPVAQTTENTSQNVLAAQDMPKTPAADISGKRKVNHDSKPAGKRAKTAAAQDRSALALAAGILKTEKMVEDNIIKIDDDEPPSVAPRRGKRNSRTMPDRDPAATPPLNP